MWNFYAPAYFLRRQQSLMAIDVPGTCEKIAHLPFFSVTNRDKIDESCYFAKSPRSYIAIDTIAILIEKTKNKNLQWYLKMSWSLAVIDDSALRKKYLEYHKNTFNFFLIATKPCHYWLCRHSFLKYVPNLACNLLYVLCQRKLASNNRASVRLRCLQSLPFG